MAVRVYHFSENPYPQAWHEELESFRITIPSRNFDPKVGAELINRYLDEWVACDELGMDIFVNEHHSTATCLTTSVMLPLAILARQTKVARLLCMGAPIGIRKDPVLVAEELAYIDVISHGRLDMGLVKGFATEIAPANINPARLNERFWEAYDLVIKAMTTHDGPFNWEGEFFHYRQVNIWPRPYQQPHPPIWVPCFGAETARAVAERGQHLVVGLGAWLAREVFATYRERVAELGRPRPDPDRFGYHLLIGIGRTEREGLDRLQKVRGYIEASAHTLEQFSSPPGFIPTAARVAALRRGSKGVKFDRARDGRPIKLAGASVADLIDAGVCFAGTPDQVFDQMKEFYDYVGGCGHFLAMMQGGHLSHADTLDSLALFSREVLPRLQELAPPQDERFDTEQRIKESTPV